MLFFDPEPKVPLSMLPHISSLLWITTTWNVSRGNDIIRPKNGWLNHRTFVDICTADTHTSRCDTGPLLCHSTVCLWSSGLHWLDIPCLASESCWRSVCPSTEPWAEGHRTWQNVSGRSPQSHLTGAAWWGTLIIAGWGREILTFSSLPTRTDATIWQAFDRSKKVSFRVKRYAPGRRKQSLNSTAFV